MLVLVTCYHFKEIVIPEAQKKKDTHMYACKLAEKDITLSQLWWSSDRCWKYYIYIITCRGFCLNYLKKMSQTWWSSVGSILQ